MDLTRCEKSIQIVELDTSTSGFEARERHVRQDESWVVRSLLAANGDDFLVGDWDRVLRTPPANAKADWDTLSGNQSPVKAQIIFSHLVILRHSQSHSQSHSELKIPKLHNFQPTA